MPGPWHWQVDLTQEVGCAHGDGRLIGQGIGNPQLRTGHLPQPQLENLGTRSGQLAATGQITEQPLITSAKRNTSPVRVLSGDSAVAAKVEANSTCQKLAGCTEAVERLATGSMVSAKR